MSSIFLLLFLKKVNKFPAPQTLAIRRAGRRKETIMPYFFYFWPGLPFFLDSNTIHELFLTAHKLFYFSLFSFQ